MWGGSGRIRDFRTETVSMSNSNRDWLKFSAIPGAISVWYFQLPRHQSLTPLYDIGRAFAA